MRTASAFVAAVAVTVAVAGCASDDDEQAPESSPGAAPVSPTADTSRSCEETMVLAAETVQTVYPTTEEPGQGWKRADALLDPAAPFPHRATSTIAVPRGLGPWFDWRSRGVQVVQATAEVTNQEHPADTATVCARVLRVTLTEVTADGARTEVEPATTYFATATRTDATQPWRVSALQQG